MATADISTTQTLYSIALPAWTLNSNLEVESWLVDIAYKTPYHPLTTPYQHSVCWESNSVFVSVLQDCLSEYEYLNGHSLLMLLHCSNYIQSGVGESNIFAYYIARNKKSEDIE